MIKKIILNSDKEAAWFNPIQKTWVSRHGKVFGNELPARMHGCTHFYCSSCGHIICKTKAASMYQCNDCYVEPK